MSLISNYKVITVTHHNLNVNEIGNFYINNQEDKLNVLKNIGSKFQIQECIYLETCNRVSYILYGAESITKSFLQEFFSFINPGLKSSTLDSIKKFVSTYSGENAVRHVFELASSMDSLVVGEREIFRQFRKAYDNCKSFGLTGDYMRLLENFTVATAKKIYSDTKIGEKSLSIVSLAMKSLLNKSPKKDSRVLLIGSGETNMLVGKFLRKYDFENVSIFNRSLDNASALSEMLSAKAYHLNELENIKANFDIIFICTSANKIVIDVEKYARMIQQDNGKKIIIDLSVPRNVSEQVVNNFNVDYIDIESLKTISEENLIFRKKEIERAKPIVDTQLISFSNNFHQRHIEKSLSDVPKKINAIKSKAIDNIYKDRIENLNPEAQKLIIEMMDYMEKKCVSVPMELSKVSK